MRPIDPLRALTLAIVAIVGLAVVGCAEPDSGLQPIPLDDGAIVSGRVTLPDARPATGVTVTLETMEGELSASAAAKLRASTRAADPAASDVSHLARALPVRATVTDAAGRFEFGGLAAGRYVVTSSARDHRTGYAQFEIDAPFAAQAETTFVDIALTPTGTFAGNVTLQNAADHRGTFVYVLGPSNVAVTDASGDFVLRDVPLGTFDVTATHAGWLDETTSGTLVAAGDSTTLPSLRLERENNIAPTVSLVVDPVIRAGIRQIHANANDLDGAIVLYEWDLQDDGVFETTTSNGTLQANFASEGVYRVKVRVTDDRGAIALDARSVDVWEAIHVATTGNDLNDGRRATPKRTISAGIVAAAAFPESPLAVHVAQGVFDEDLTLANVTIRGGHVLPQWTVGTQRTIIRGSAVGVALSNCEFEHLTFEARPASTPGAHSIALTLVDTVEEVFFYDCLFSGQTGANGASGANGTPGANGTTGEAGQLGSTHPLNGLLPGEGGWGGVVGGGRGGPSTDSRDGYRGSDALGGAGGEGGTAQALQGQPGGDGADAPRGAHGAAAASSPGVLTGSTLVATAGNDGSTADGGGGGGGGANFEVIVHRGGGGGGGGRGGTPGRAGRGGGSSFGLFAHGNNAGAYFNDCTFLSQPAGHGGSGGNGAEGGSGGNPGIGATNCGRGGFGGNGADSGGGSGGAGGWSFGAYCAGGSAPDFQACSFPLDEQVAGNGGQGGWHGDLANRAPSGPSGQAGTLRITP